MAVGNSLVARKETFSTFLTTDAVKNKVNQIIGGKDGQRFITAILSAVSINPALAECEHGSILSSAMLGESLKLSPSPQLGQYYMVPYKKKDKQGNIVSITAQFQIGYKGYIQLAIRSGYYKKINVLAIKQGELKNFDPLNETIDCLIIEDEEARETAPTIGYYAMFEYLNGFRKALYWSMTKMEKHADTYSQAFKLADYRLLKEGKVPSKDLWKYSSFWYKDFDAMAYKTMLRQLISKWGIMSIEMQNAIAADMEFVEEKPEYAGNVTTIQPSEVDNFFDAEPPSEDTLFEGDPGTGAN